MADEQPQPIQPAPVISQPAPSGRRWRKYAYALLAIAFVAVAFMLAKTPLMNLKKFSNLTFKGQKISADTQIKIYAGLKDKVPINTYSDSEFLNDTKLKDEQKIKEHAYRLLALRAAAKEKNAKVPSAEDLTSEAKRISLTSDQQKLDKYKEYYYSFAEVSLLQNTLKNEFVTEKNVTFVAVAWDLPKSITSRDKAVTILENLYMPMLKEGKDVNSMSVYALQPFLTRDGPKTTVKLDPAKAAVVYPQTQVIGRPSYGMLKVDDGMQESMEAAVKNLKQGELSKVFDMNGSIAAVARLDSISGSGSFDSWQQYYDSLRNEFK